MKRAIWVALGSMVLFQTIQAYALDQIISVSISPAVQERLKKASVDEHLKVEAAIKAANIFIPQHLDGTAYDVPQDGDKKEYAKWLKKTRPLINKEMKDWYTDTEVQANSALAIEINGKKGNLLVLCPQAELVSIDVVTEHFNVGWETYYPVSFAGDNVVLRYRTKVAGMWTYSGHIDDFIPDNQGDFEEVLISLDKENKISQVLPQYSASGWTSNRMIGVLKRDIEHPMVLMGETKAEVDERNVGYGKLINKVNADVDAVCSRGAAAVH